MTQPLNSDGQRLPTMPAELLAILQKLDIQYELHRHAPIFTVEEGLPLKKSIPGLHCRNLFLRDKKEKMFLVVAANETAIDLKSLPALLDSGRLSFGSAERLWRHLGITPGSVCPFTVINDKERQVEVILDDFMMKAGKVCYHPLDNAQTICLAPADLMRFFEYTGHKPRILDIRSDN
ncbi:MAG: prolyl-tRNA synthetase associated domain-containing protein [Alphaproteobacteria bacterium]|nr:prolyl-tRNA synthetase associated domain-containing protein [Alphaproteobacteria bacterium]